MIDGAAQGSVQETIRRLAGVDAGALPLLSVYLDTRPHATGESPGRRAGFTLVRDRLREIGRAHWPRGADWDSFDADRARIEAFLAEELDPAAAGLALFACHGIGLWETVQTGVPFRDSITSGPTPDLFQLARLVDQLETAVVALVDTNTARLFVSRLGSLEERDGPDEGTESFRKRQMGGWSQARYQRHIDKHVTDFAKGTGDAIDRLMEQEDADHLVLAGDEVAITPLRDALSTAARDRVVTVLRADIRTERDPLQEAVADLLAQVEEEEGRSAADRVLGGVRAGGLAVAGADATRSALEIGAVDTLVLLGPSVPAPEQVPYQDARDLTTSVETEGEPHPVDAATREELVRQATLTGARIEVVADHPGLARSGGVGALLRYPVA